MAGAQLVRLLVGVAVIASLGRLLGSVARRVGRLPVMAEIVVGLPLAMPDASANAGLASFLFGMGVEFAGEGLRGRGVRWGSRRWRRCWSRSCSGPGSRCS